MRENLAQFILAFLASFLVIGQLTTDDPEYKTAAGAVMLFGSIATGIAVAVLWK